MLLKRPGSSFMSITILVLDLGFPVLILEAYILHMASGGYFTIQNNNVLPFRKLIMNKEKSLNGLFSEDGGELLGQRIVFKSDTSTSITDRQAILRQLLVQVSILQVYWGGDGFHSRPKPRHS